MPKAQKNHKQTKGAVLARERREREKIETLYNNSLKEFLQLKYRHIIAEFDPIYQAIMARRPKHMIYTNTKEFQLWRRREFHKELQPEQRPEQQAEQLIDPQLLTMQPEQQPEHQAEQQAEQLNDPQQLAMQPEQQPEHQAEQQAEQLNDPQQLVMQPEQQPEHQAEQQAEQLNDPQQLAELLPDLGVLVNDILEPVDPQQDELLPVLGPLVNGDDEGIALDAWEELQGDIRDFNYRLEVELGQYLP